MLLGENSIGTDNEAREQSRLLFELTELSSLLHDDLKMDAQQGYFWKKHPETESDAKGKERMKRKVIFRGGNYGHSGRRGGVGGDPYGRRRGHYGQNGPSDSWPYRRPDFPSSNSPMNGNRRSSSSAGSISNPASDSTRHDTENRPREAGTPDKISANSQTSPAHSVLGLRNDKRRHFLAGNDTPVNTRVRSSSKTKLTRTMKLEIAKFALQYGIQRAAERYSVMVGRTLQPRKIQKFMRRYQIQQRRERGY